MKKDYSLSTRILFLSLAGKENITLFTYEIEHYENLDSGTIVYYARFQEAYERIFFLLRGVDQNTSQIINS